jgi:hypothetical protein
VFGLNERLQHWFAVRGDAIVESENDLWRFEFSRHGAKNIVVREWHEEKLEQLSDKSDPAGIALLSAWSDGGLTGAQQAVLRLRALGFSDDEIARKLA